MLEDPSYDAIVRWGEGGESFVVLEVWDSRNDTVVVLVLVVVDVDPGHRTKNSPSLSSQSILSTATLRVLSGN